MLAKRWVRLSLYSQFERRVSEAVRWSGAACSRDDRVAPRDAPVLLVVERQAEQIAEGRQRPFGRVGLGLFERALMGRSPRAPSHPTFPCPTPLPSRHTAPPARTRMRTLGRHRRRPWARRFTSCPHAFGHHRLAVPALVPEETIGFGDDAPTLDIADGRPVARARPDVAIAQFGFERLHAVDR